MGKMENKRGVQLAISTIILLVIGLIVLVGIVSILIMGWDDFKTAVGAALGNDLSQAKRNCAIACASGNTETYCEIRTIGELKDINCNNEAIKPKDCSLEC